MKPTNMLRLAFVAQALTLDIILPNWIMAFVGTYFVFFLVMTFCGWRWALFYQFANVLMTFANPITLVIFSAPATVAPVAQTITNSSLIDRWAAGVVSAINAWPFPLDIIGRLGLILLYVGELAFSLYYILIWPYLWALKIRARLPAGGWNMPRWKGIRYWHGFLVLTRNAAKAKETENKRIARRNRISARIERLFRLGNE